MLKVPVGSKVCRVSCNKNLNLNQSFNPIIVEYTWLPGQKKIYISSFFAKDLTLQGIERDRIYLIAV